MRLLFTCLLLMLTAFSASSQDDCYRKKAESYTAMQGKICYPGYRNAEFASLRDAVLYLKRDGGGLEYRSAYARIGHSGVSISGHTRDLR